MVRHFNNKNRCVHVLSTVIAILIILGFATQSCSADDTDALKSEQSRLIHRETSSRADDPFDGIYFPTVYKSGFDVCTNSDGQPVIFLFSSSTCSHCEWVGDIFDAIVTQYVEKGLIEAHHYDKPTGDDLLTEESESEISEEIMAIYNLGNPTNRVPYINFSCKYERIGNGYETSQDADAEGREIMEVIETLIQVLSTSEKK